ncbi:hypothetical protein TWF730_009584 [Orbilia blumenaviensis]|uniref:Uncharacterized protein n=1 Tax=Orbilia blumenaviensis TaxID=1796055 RepID=A0AAV9USI3_9PEZI
MPLLWISGKLNLVKASAAMQLAVVTIVTLALALSWTKYINHAGKGARTSNLTYACYTIPKYPSTCK